MLGYFYPTATGPQTFYLAADDYAVLYLSTDSNPANKQLIASVVGWTGNRDYAKYPSQTSTPITLTAGQPYYIEALMKEGGGGDNLSVSIDAVGPIAGTQLSTIDKTSGPISITTPPQSQTVAEGSPVNFIVGVDGTPPYSYTWKRNGATITDATNANYSIPFASFGDNGAQFSVAVSNLTTGAVSSPATLTVQQDTTKPTIIEVSGSGDFKHVKVTYSERIDPATGTNSANYTINGGIAVTLAELQGSSVVILTTSTQTGGTNYVLTVSNVKDMAFVPNTIVANTQVSFNTAVFKTGLSTWERYDGGSTIDDFVLFLADPNHPAPNATGALPYLGYPRDLNDQYRGRASGYFVAPATTNYVFFVAADDNAYVFLSTDSDPANKKKIAFQPGWSPINQWIDPDTTEVRSDVYTGSEWPTPNVITLTQGQRYFIEVAHQEGGGGDGSEVYYKYSGAPDPANGTVSNVRGSVIGIFVDPATLPPLITNAPGNIAFNPGDTVIFSVGVESTKPVRYQWFKNAVNLIPGATNSTLVFSNAQHTIIGDYSVTVSNANGVVSTGNGDNSRALMRGAFVIEAEDFNFGTNQFKPAANVMPYTGNAYLNETNNVLDIDFFNRPDASGGAAFAYNRFDPADPGVLDMKGPADPADYFRGDFNVTANYAIGWTTTGEWHNYTRTFPDGTYVVYAALAYDGRAADQLNQTLSVVANPTIPDGSSLGVEGGLQGLTKIGDFKGPATGAWSSNDLFPLKDAAGNSATVSLTGTKTLRWTFNKSDGDADYLLLYRIGPAASVGPRITSITKSGNNITITWPAGPTLESAPSLGAPGSTIIWTSTGDTSGSHTEAMGTTSKFFRLRQ